MSRNDIEIKTITEDQANDWYSKLEATTTITTVPWKHAIDSLYVDKYMARKGLYSVIADINQDGDKTVSTLTIILEYLSRLYRGIYDVRQLRGQNLEELQSGMRKYIDSFIDVNAHMIISTLLEANATVSEIEEVVRVSTSKVLKANFSLIN